ncbi:hypothetical protein SAMN05421636_11250 [Pricia antarctica]|uniref:DUF6249 domain-containing protein n=1 Tax=Pricia antarctica TaxID=641691 RepID=A0A1G7IJD3_9FLAO|nr:DUF6249 domain-containing protein [Pricia antarctica]SDF12725.1 hypothetical protein SAMN05421636_11250 [Pricia antarctica]
MGSEFVIIGFLAAAAFTIYYLIKSRHAEQMAKIEHGIACDDESNFKSNLILNLGIVLSALGAAVFVSYMVGHFTKMPDYISMPGFLLLFAGLGFLVSNRINKNRDS